jgi:hypothetical protein
MTFQSVPQDPLVLSYLTLRKAVGIIGCALPFVLAFGKILLQGQGLQGSISAYYYTSMRDVFVGSLCAIGVFLLSTKGYDWHDELAGAVACICAVGVALFPTAPDTNATPQELLIGSLHLWLAAVFFVALAIFCLFLFTKMAPNPTHKKIVRNRFYRLCGSIIVACVLLILLVNRVPAVKAAVAQLNPIFWLESIAVLAFGVAWLIKGETFLKDEHSSALRTAAALSPLPPVAPTARSVQLSE